MGDESSKFANGANQNAGNCITDRPSTRLHQAPGGNSTICLGHDDSEVADTSGRSTGPRPSPGGPTTISLTYDETPSKSEPVEMVPEPEPAGVYLGPPHGQSRICLGVTDSEEKEDNPPVVKLSESSKQPPGGCSTICLSYDPQIDETPSKLQPPGGNATICLGANDDNMVIDVPPSGRKAPGGEATICLGTTEPVEPEVKAVGQTPGGNSTICFGASDDTEPSSSKKFIHAAGGPTSICFGAIDDTVQVIRENNIPPGGKTSICLGLADVGDECNLGSEERPERPVGGPTTLCLGVLDEDRALSEVKDSGRGHVPPGGTTTICLGFAKLPLREPSHRQAPGGNTTICLGEDFSDENVNTSNSVMIQTDEKLKPNKVLGEQSTQDTNCVLLQ